MEFEELKYKIIELQLELEGKKYMDKSILLQEDFIFHSLVEIVDDIKAVVANVGEDGLLDELEDILLVRDIKNAYLKLYNSLYKLFNEISSQLRNHKRPWVDAKCIETYINNNHAAGRTEFDKKYLEDTNSGSIYAIDNTRSVIRKISNIVMNELDYGRELLEKIQFDEESIRHKVESEVIKYSNEYYDKTFKELKQEAQNLKAKRSDSLSPAIWGDVMERENNALELAIKGNGDFLPAEHGLCGVFEEMTKNGKLLQQIRNVSLDDELFDFDRAAKEYIHLYSSLTPENIDLFYYLILRHNIIRCETFPDELKEKYKEWLNKDKEETLSDADKKLLECLLNYVEKADWQKPANSENIKKFITKLFEHREFRDFFKEGRGAKTGRVEVSMANIFGYLLNCNFLVSSPQKINKDVFGKNNLVNNINKGKKLEGNKNFKDLLPLMDKYRQKFIV